MENPASLPFSKSSPLLASPLCPQLINAAKLQTSTEDLPFLCAAALGLKHKLNKICLEISLGFPLDFYLGEPKNPNADLITEAAELVRCSWIRDVFQRLRQQLLID